MADGDSGFDPSESDGFEDDYDAELSDESYLTEADFDSEFEDDSFDRNEYTAELSDFSYDQKHNDVGEKVEGPASLEDEKFLDNNGNVDWKSFAKNADDDGFDKSQPIENIKLNPGDTFVRYGSGRGHFGAPPGSDYDSLSLPYQENSQEYHTYQIVPPVECRT